jgi:hypothetical protein
VRFSLVATEAARRVDANLEANSESSQKPLGICVSIHGVRPDHNALRRAVEFDEQLTCADQYDGPDHHGGDHLNEREAAVSTDGHTAAVRTPMAQHGLPGETATWTG